jgi:recombination protein RecR
MFFPSSIQNLINQFNKLPGIGIKTAEKFVFYLLKQPKGKLKEFNLAFEELEKKIIKCSLCFNFTEINNFNKDGFNFCSICADSQRDKSILCVIAEPQDLLTIEKTNEYHGLYHILNGVINTIKEIGPERLKIKELIQRIRNSQSSTPVKEIILAFNPDIEGETTILYLTKIFKPSKIKITRLARGLPMGSELEYADEITLTNALKNRQNL